MKIDAVPPDLLEAIDSELLGGEELKWIARPLGWQRAWRKSGGVIVISVLLLLVWYLATLLMAPTLVAYVAGLSLLIAALLIFLVAQEVVDAWRTIYAITNRRVIVVKGGFRRRVISYSAKDLERIERRGDDVGDIIFRQPAHGDDSSFNGTLTLEGLFAIPHVREVEALLLETFQPGDTLPEKVKRLSGNESQDEAVITPPEAVQHSRHSGQ